MKMFSVMEQENVSISMTHQFCILLFSVIHQSQCQVNSHHLYSFNQFSTPYLSRSLTLVVEDPLFFATGSSLSKLSLHSNLQTQVDPELSLKGRLKIIAIMRRFYFYFFFFWKEMRRIFYVKARRFYHSWRYFIII